MDPRRDQLDNIFVNNHKYFLDVIANLPKSDQYRAIRYNLITRFEKSQHFCDVASLCVTCGASYQKIPNILSLKPPKKTNRFLRRLRKKNKGDEVGTPYQISSLNKYKKYSNGQTLLRTCRACNLKRKRKVEKPIRSKTKVNTVEEPINKTKKLRKKNKFAGLQEDAVLSVLAKKRKLYDSVIVLDTPESNPKISESGQKNIIAEIDNSVIYIDKTPMLNETIDSNIADDNVVNLITPNSTPIAINDTAASFTTDQESDISLSPLKIKENIPSSKKKTKPRLVISKNKFNRQKCFENLESTPRTSRKNKNSPQTVHTKKDNTSLRNEISTKSAKKKNKNRSKKRNPEVSHKKFNSLEKLLKTGNMKKKNTNLEKFLESVS